MKYRYFYLGLVFFLFSLVSGLSCVSIDFGPITNGDKFHAEQLGLSLLVTTFIVCGAICLAQDSDNNKD